MEGVQRHVREALAACSSLDNDVREYCAEVAGSVLSEADSVRSLLTLKNEIFINMQLSSIQMKIFGLLYILI